MAAAKKTAETLRRNRYSDQQRQRNQPYAYRGYPIKRFDLMFGVNVRGTYLCTQACLPFLKIRRAATQSAYPDAIAAAQL